MKKTLIKCDKCGTLLDYENSSEENNQFYNLTREDFLGWATLDKSSGRNSTFQICLKCFNSFEIPPKDFYGRTIIKK
jgi:hypothetical protein